MAVTARTVENNMNGKYILSATAGSNLSLFPAQYRDYPGGVDFFDIYSPPITTLYSQVYWTMMDPVDLPQEIIKRFEDKGMAIVGFEFDQVRKTSTGDISVPMNLAYNHHFETSMTGKYSYMKKTMVNDIPEDFTNMGHNHPNSDYIMEPAERGQTRMNIPTSQSLSAGNGGEARKSFHGFAPGFAQVINSPQKFYVTPMQIDTWNRDKMNLTGSPFVAGPLPKHSLAPKDAIYSGLLECPLTTRITKLVDSSYKRIVQFTCASPLNLNSCNESRYHLGLPSNTVVQLHIVNTTTLPSQCSGSFVWAQTNDSASEERNVLNLYFNKHNDMSGPAINCGQNLTTVFGSVESLTNTTLTLNQTTALLRISGPSTVWFGIGFNATTMGDDPWTIIVDGDGKVSEYLLGNHNPGKQLNRSSVTLSSAVRNGIRTVLLKFPMEGKHLSLSLDIEQLNIITAIGSSVELKYHKAKTTTTVYLFPAGTPFCICGDVPPPFGKGTGKFRYQDGTEVGFVNKCQPEPRTDMLKQKNPTCDVRTYVGGQLTCHHMWSLLDADQAIPWSDQPLTYHLKFRIWFQDYSAREHVNVKRTTWGIASPVEYDVPQCPAGTPSEQCIHRISGTFTVPENIHLVAAHFHCHAPTCLDISLYDNETGTLICTEKPLYGDSMSQKFGEPGYILQPPCLWGSAKYGLDPPVSVGGKTLTAIKHSNSTYGHHGEMAWLQMFYV